VPVYYTRRREKRIDRVRECRNCGRRMVTREAMEFVLAACGVVAVHVPGELRGDCDPE
jgi:transcriptional regulator NrdR family protein